MLYPSFIREFSLQQREILVAGFDEVGRGCLAGPVVAGAVVITPESIPIIGIMDSKTVSENRRRVLAELVKAAHIHAIGAASNDEIDTLGIVEATRLAMLRAYWQLPVKPTLLLVDGEKTTKSLLGHSFHYVRGDQRIYSVAAASIIAKVYRDELMSNIGGEDDMYGFKSHKGYGTAFHYSALKEHGISKFHRKTFLKNLSM